MHNTLQEYWELILNNLEQDIDEHPLCLDNENHVALIKSATQQFLFAPSEKKS